MGVEQLGPAERLAAGAIGEPGQRQFYLEVTTAGAVHSFPCEKSQIAELATRGLQLLISAGLEADSEAVERIVQSGLEINEPAEPRFRIGSIGVGVTPNQFVSLTFGNIEDEDDLVGFVVTPEQFRAMALVALEVVAAGRPLCQWCGLPIDPAGHRCPAANGHHPPNT
jgi:uncharacterized repeat protein (TIGR03847 family)